MSEDTIVELAFEQALSVRVNIDSGEVRFEVGAVGDPTAPHLVHLPAEDKTAIPGGPLDAEDKAVLNDPRVVRAFELLAVGGDGDRAWDWSEGVAEAANECLGRLVKRVPPS